MALALFVLATARDSIASFVNGLVIVYTILIIAYILSSMYFAFGGRLPYARWSSATTPAATRATRPHAPSAISPG